MFDGVPEHWNDEPRPANDDPHELTPLTVLFHFIVILACASILTFYATRVLLLLL
jgi:hypothetical protein